MHPYQAELMCRDFERRDRHALAQLASLYKPNVPIHQNPDYVARARELAAETEAELRGEARGAKGRTERGWAPPSLADVETARSTAAE